MIVIKVHDPILKTFPTYRKHLVELREINQELNFEVRTKILEAVVNAVMRRGKLGERGNDRNANHPAVAMFSRAYNVEDALELFEQTYGTEYLLCFETICMAHDGCVARGGDIHDYIMILQFFMGIDGHTLGEG